MIQSDYNFIRASANAQSGETLAKPDSSRARALCAAGETIFIDFLLERVPVLSVEDAKHCSGGEQCCRHREGEDSAAKALEAREGKGEFRARARRRLRRRSGGVYRSGFGCGDGHRLKTIDVSMSYLDREQNWVAKTRYRRSPFGKRLAPSESQTCCRNNRD